MIKANLLNSFLLFAMTISIFSHETVNGKPVNGQEFEIKPIESQEKPIFVKSKYNAATHKSIILNFDDFPSSPWITYNCGGEAKSKINRGILKIDSPLDCKEYSLVYPSGIWHQYVDNSRGWIIEASLRVNAKSTPSCHMGRGSNHIWANDHTNLIIVGFDPQQLCLAYPDYVAVPMNTTNSFHIYRIESKLNKVQIYVDGKLKIDKTLSWTGGGSNILNFGDGVGGDTSLVYWDYFSYNVFPQFSGPLIERRSVQKSPVQRPLTQPKPKTRNR